MAHRGCEVSVHGDTQHLNYHGSGQPDIADTAFMQWRCTTLSPQVPSNLSDYASLCPKIILWVFEQSQTSAMNLIQILLLEITLTHAPDNHATGWSVFQSE